MLVLASSGCAYLLPDWPECIGRADRDTLVAGAAALSSATGGQVPRLVEGACEWWSYEVVTYPGTPKDEVAARMAGLPFCTAHDFRIDSKTTRAMWECEYSGKNLKVAFYPDEFPVYVRIEVAH